MCKELCELSDDGEMQSCPDCGRLICWDVEGGGDDVICAAYVTSCGDLCCAKCGSKTDRIIEAAEDEDFDYDPHEWHDDDDDHSAFSS